MQPLLGRQKESLAEQAFVAEINILALLSPLSLISICYNYLHRQANEVLVSHTLPHFDLSTSVANQIFDLVTGWVLQMFFRLTLG